MWFVSSRRAASDNVASARMTIGSIAMRSPTVVAGRGFVIV
jgi:hypothetical protein